MIKLSSPGIDQIPNSCEASMRSIQFMRQYL